MTDTIALPLWAVAAAVFLLLLFAAVAIRRVGAGQTFGFLGKVAASLLVLGLAWLFLDRMETQTRTEQRRAIESRIAALTAQAFAPNSHIACIDAIAGDAVQEACEKALYASPEAVSAALGYVGAKLDILRDIAALPDSLEQSYEVIRAPFVRSLQEDRYGLVAQVLAGREGCTPDQCHVFAWLQKYDQVAANMRDRAYDVRVVRHAGAWGEKQPSGPALAAQTAPAPAAPQVNPVNINFPTAASIPAVSIMTNEPGMPGQNGVDASAPKPEAKPAAQPAPRRAAQKAPAPKQAPPPPAQAAPFPQPVGTAPAPQAQQTIGTPVQITPQ